MIKAAGFNSIFFSEHHFGGGYSPAPHLLIANVALRTGFHPQSKVIEIFDAYRDEAARIGREVGPDDLCIRRQVTLLDGACLQHRR